MTPTTAVRLTWKLSSGPGGGGGSPFGGGQAQLFPLDVSLRLGEPVRVSYANGSMTLDEDARFSTELVDNEQTVVLTGDCLVAEGGKTHLLFLNTAADSQAISSMNIERLDAVPNNELVIDCASQPAPAGGQPAPAGGQPAPAGGQPAPAGGQPAPAGGQPAMAGNGG